MIDVTYKLEIARRYKPSNITWVKLKDDVNAEWIVDTTRPDIPEGLVALQHWCSGSYRWASAEAIEKLLEQSK